MDKNKQDFIIRKADHIWKVESDTSLSEKEKMSLINTYIQNCNYVDLLLIDEYITEHYIKHS